MEWHPLTFEPILKPKTWGGRRLAALLGKTLPTGEGIGESWELSDQPGDVSVVADGPLAGRSLHDLVAADAPALLGRPLRDADGGRFPVLAKFIDAAELLSLQVHPTEEMARQLGGQARAKTECWYVIAAEPDAWIYLGTRPGVTRQEIARALETEDADAINAVLNRLPVAPGDFIYAPAGTVHAIGAGLLFAEVSQTSDTTLRLYDWGRLPKRPTHIPQGLAAMRLAPDGLGEAGKCQASSAGNHLSRLVGCAAFSVYRLDLKAGDALRLSGSCRCAFWMTVAGAGVLDWGGGALDLRAGRTCLIPAGAYAATLTAQEDLVMLIVSPPS